MLSLKNAPQGLQTFSTAREITVSFIPLTQTSQKEATHVEASLHHRKRHLAEVLALFVAID